MRKKILLILAGVIFVLIVSIPAAYYYLIRYPLPALDGEMTLPGLKAPVKVYRDSWGVPHIYASNQHDLFMAQGFDHAQDRLWQMETCRRIAAGRLSEIIGSDTVALDKMLRTLGFMRAAKREVASFEKPALDVLQAYSDGVNAFLTSRGGRLPFEFRLLGVEPEPWLPEHTIGWSKVIALLGGKNWQEEIVRAMLVGKLGPEKAEDLMGGRYPGTPSIIPSRLKAPM